MDFGILQAIESSQVPLKREFPAVLHIVFCFWKKNFFLLDEKSGKW